MKKIAVVGLGRFGASLAMELQKLGCNVLAMDKDEKLANKLSNFISRLVIIDATDKDALLELGIESMETVVVAITSNFEASVLITLVLKELNIPNIIATAGNEYHGEILMKLGANSVIYPEKDMGIQLARSLIKLDIV